MSVLPIRPLTAASSVAEVLRAELLSGSYAPGTQLRESDLVERDGISPATARAALAELAREGLVVHTLNRGVEVIRITQDDVRDIYAARRVFEVSGLETLLRGRPVDVSWLYVESEDSGYVIVPVDPPPARLRLVQPAPQDSAPDPGPTLVVALLARSALTPLRLTVRLAPALAGDAARVAARLR